MKKRIFDLLCILIFAPLILPVLFLTSILVYFFLGSPILFSQMRPGLGEKPFRMYKFRTMTDKVDGANNLLSDELRLTRFGHLLRSSSLDELPSLINIVRGDMSLVGPRPLLMQYLPLYNQQQRKRHLAKPGLTGWAQVNGRNAISWEQKFELDVWYIENQSFLLDMKVLFLTLKKVISRQGITSDGHATTNEFKGTKKSD